MKKESIITLKRSGFKFTKADFKAWLAKQKPKREYECGDSDRCIVAQFLTDRYNEGTWSVDGHGYTPPDPERMKLYNKISDSQRAILDKVYGEDYTLPEWAKRLVRDFDDLHLNFVTTADFLLAVKEKRVKL